MSRCKLYPGRVDSATREFEQARIWNELASKFGYDDDLAGRFLVRVKGENAELIL